jgi:ATP-dependent RNA helicase DOB1
LKKFEEEHDQVVIEREAEVSHYYHLRQQIETLRTQLMNFITQPKYILPFLNPGRIIKVVNKDDDFGWVSCLN